ncbi:rCG62542 [Rattus norvegicus]|uniref:RCG62542 n=1 Tax=Rattus norvegicus TaxID=10116 RepID=A6J5R8_RAT|nr:rCG62542 [Rattus norvegicus]
MTYQDFLDLIKEKLKMEKHGSVVINISCSCTGLESASQKVGQKTQLSGTPKPTCILAWCWFERDSCSGGWILLVYAAEDDLDLPIPPAPTTGITLYTTMPVPVPKSQATRARS